MAWTNWRLYSCPGRSLRTRPESADPAGACVPRPGASRHSGGAGGSWPLVADFLDVAQGVTQPGQPGVGVLSGQPHAPGQRVAAAAGHARLDQRVEHPAFGLAQPGHDRDGQRGEHLGHARAGDAPGHLAPELVLGLPGDLDPAAPGLLAEPADPALGGGGPLGVRRPFRLGGGQFPYDRDLLAVRLDLRRGREPVARQPAAEPAAYLFRSAPLPRSASLTRRGLVCAHIVTRSRVLAASVRIAIRPG